MSQSPTAANAYPDDDLIVNLTVTDTEQSWTVPDHAVAYTIHPLDGNVKMRVVSGASEYFTIKKGFMVTETGLTIEKKKKYFVRDGDTNVKLQILVRCGSGQVEFRGGY